MLEILSLPTLGDRLRWARGRRNINAKDLARQSGVAPSVIWNAEGKRGNNTIRKLTAVAAVLQVDPDWLATGNGSPFLSQAAQPDPQSQHLPADDPEMRMLLDWLEIWRGADTGDRSLIESIFTMARKHQQQNELRRA